VKFIKVIIKYPLECIAGIMFSILTITVFFQVISRYIFRAPFPWPEELAMLLFVWTCLLGAAIGVRNDSHYSVSFLFDLFPEKIKGFLEILINIFVAFLVVYWGWMGIKSLPVASNQIYSALRIPRSWLNVSLPASCSLMFLFSLINIYNKIKKLMF